MYRIKNIKIWVPRIFLFAIFLAFTNMISFSQVPSVLSDTTKVSQSQTESDNANQDQTQTKTQAQTQTQNQEQVKNQNQGEVQKSAVGKTIKQVRRSAKPDMSKARGARPNIVRPSGSTIPKGVGKPGGARRIGGR